MNYLVWTVVALAAYTLFPPLVSLAAREIPSNVITLVATAMLATGALGVALVREDEILTYLTGSGASYAYLAGLSLTVGIFSRAGGPLERPEALRASLSSPTTARSPAGR